MNAAARAVIALLFAAAAWPASTAAQTVEEFYRNKSITMLVGGGAGGGYDTYARVFASHLSRHIPGSPTIIAKNMPAAAGLGGGSADAAAALRLLADEGRLSADDSRVRDAAKATGAVIGAPKAVANDQGLPPASGTTYSLPSRPTLTSLKLVPLAKRVTVPSTVLKRRSPDAVLPSDVSVAKTTFWYCARPP